MRFFNLDRSAGFRASDSGIAAAAGAIAGIAAAILMKWMTDGRNRKTFASAATGASGALASSSQRRAESPCCAGSMPLPPGESLDGTATEMHSGNPVSLRSRGRKTADGSLYTVLRPIKNAAPRGMARRIGIASVDANSNEIVAARTATVNRRTIGNDAGILGRHGRTQEAGLAQDMAAEPPCAEPARETQHGSIRHEAEQTALQIGHIFEKAFADGGITIAALSECQYSPIPGACSPEYAGRFDVITDRVLAPLHEAFLKRLPGVVYAGTVGSNGWFAAHLLEISQALDGSRPSPLVMAARDRSSKGRERKMRQAYWDDAGEVMHYLSVPIVVRGRHWGDFRVGYHPDSCIAAN